MKHFKKSALVVAGLALAACAAMAAPINSFPNLVEAQKLIDQSLGHITQAQGNNHGKFGGHASRAKELLEQAKHELDEAANYAEHQAHH